MIRIKTLLEILAGASLVAGATFALWPKPVEVETAAVVRGELVQAVEEDGKTRVRDRYVVSAPVAGILGRVGLKVGDAVEEGAVVASIAPIAPPLLDARSLRSQRARLGAAEAARMRALAAVERAGAADRLAAADVERIRALVASGALPPRERDRAEAEAQAAAKELEAARFAVRVAEHEIEEARAAADTFARPAEPGKERREIRSPVGGRVLRVVHESEAVVAAGEPLLEIADPAAIEVVVDVLSADAVQIEPGAAVDLLRWGGERPLAGRVRAVEPAGVTKISALGVEEQRVNVLVDLVSPRGEWAALGDGFRVEARIVVRRHEDALKAPASAVFRDEGGWAVYTIAGGRAKKRAVAPGRSDGIETAIERGIQPGERVIRHVPDTVRDGTRIAPSARR